MERRGTATVPTRYRPRCSTFYPLRINKITSLGERRGEASKERGEESICGADGDGRPGPEEAWAGLPEERGALGGVWTEEMENAFGVARSLLQDRDEIGARMAFKGVYPKLVGAARAERR